MSAQSQVGSHSLPLTRNSLLLLFVPRWWGLIKQTNRRQEGKPHQRAAMTNLIIEYYIWGHMFSLFRHYIWKPGPGKIWHGWSSIRNMALAAAFTWTFNWTANPEWSGPSLPEVMASYRNEPDVVLYIWNLSRREWVDGRGVHGFTPNAVVVFMNWLALVSFLNIIRCPHLPSHGKGCDFKSHSNHINYLSSWCLLLASVTLGGNRIWQGHTKAWFILLNA